MGSPYTDIVYTLYSELQYLSEDSDHVICWTREELMIDLLQGVDICLFPEVFKLALEPSVASCLIKNGSFSPKG
jgi:hypothetical protein